jgi:hypothetical protein
MGAAYFLLYWQGSLGTPITGLWQNVVTARADTGPITAMAQTTIQQ